ncbi:Hypothetical_protein [Hexamita inflata]|uniref:Hypothetical_protein n=1 Tax=Hexamita inflata TaxID=28002 RepID=A0AA86UYR9_9EUKA|nr:Hypothetical protein HINF_LOCUS57527 [Hexamita inflata]
MEALTLLQSYYIIIISVDRKLSDQDLFNCYAYCKTPVVKDQKYIVHQNNNFSPLLTVQQVLDILENVPQSCQLNDQSESEQSDDTQINTLDMEKINQQIYKNNDREADMFNVIPKNIPKVLTLENVNNILRFKCQEQILNSKKTQIIK